MMDIPYWSMIPAFTEGGKERENLSTLARSCAGVGSAIISIVTVMAVAALGGKNEAAGFSRFALIVAVIFIVFITLTCVFIKEKSTVNTEAPSLKEMFRALIQNDQAMAIVITIVLVNCSIYITSNLVIYFFKYDFGGEGWRGAYTLFNTFGGGIQILSMMILFPLLRKFLDTMQVFYLSFIMAILGYVSLLVLAFTNMSSVYLLFIPGFLIFAANGMLTVLTTIFLANTVDYGELKNNRRDESVIFSMQTFVVKLASGVAALLASLCLAIFNLKDDTSDAIAQAASTSSKIGLRMFMTVLPIIGLFVAMMYFKKKYILTEKKVEEIAAEVRARHTAD